ncbi:hypothetical protein L1N85_19485 [Paenibacillus alkaliterrae]|uniref:Athe_2463 domain-containing protein n=1 Tax=Paenibacillus alkaliterrae TaxID=320909 RepID=UPI001F187289|nr:hypothetical protein [Paenibacillus alkaliterrae]MCF2940579.1 hypothetical protein [Paenibacillus alkaliterrae]
MQRLKRNVSTWLAAMMILQLLQLIVVPTSFVETAYAAEKINGFDNPCGYNVQSDGPIPSGVRPCNSDGYKFNSRLYSTAITMNAAGKVSAPLQMIVYGDHYSVPAKSQDYKRGWQNEQGVIIDPEPNGEGHFYAYDIKYGGYTYGEFRYLGFTIDGSLYHNNYFIVDDDVGNSLDKKHWVFKPWDNLPSSWRHKPSSPGFVYQGDEDRTTLPKFNNLLRNIQRSLGFTTITQGVSYSNRYKVLTNTTENRDPRNYMAVNQPATAREAGFGTMFHYSWDSHSLWYQTVPLLKVKGPEKTPPPAACVATPVSKQPLQINKERTIKVQVKVKGTLQDTAYFGNLAAEAIFYTRREVNYWNLELTDIQKNSDIKLSSSNKSQGVVVKDNNGEGIFTLVIDTDRLTKTSDPKVLKYSTNANATAVYVNDASSDVSRSTSPTCKLDITFQSNGKGTMLSDFNAIPQIMFEKKSEFTSSMLGYKDLSYGKDVDYYRFEITNDEDGTKISKTFDPAIPEVKKPKAGYLDQDAVRKYLYDFMGSKFSESSTDRVVKTFQIKQTIVDRDAATNNESIAMKTVVVVQDVPAHIIGGCENPDVKLRPKPPQYIQPESSWPQDWYDVVPFPVTDGVPNYIPAASCEDPPGYDEFTKRAFIDGNEIDVDQFFAGEYIFGEDQIGLREVKVVWTAPDGTESFMIQHAVIHETKPRVSLQIEGTFKQNRTMNAYDRSAASNDQWVEQNAPLEITSFSYVNADDPSLKCRTGYCEINLSQKMFMYKDIGNYQMSIAAKRVIPYGNGNSITRYSDPYVVDYEIMPDHKPAIIAHAYGAEVSRLDKLQLFYDVQSTDGDFIASKNLKVFYDSDNNDSFETKVFESTDDLKELPEFTKLGQYQIIVDAKEGTNEERLMEFISPDDDKTHTMTSYFFVDNYAPSSDLYLEVPNVKPDMDVFFMLDSNLTQVSTDYVKNNKVTLTNAFTTANMLANVGIWDMKTYTYSQSASTSKSTGSSYPPSTTTYTSEGYSGTLSRTSVSNSPYSRDEGSYKSVTESKTATDSCSNTVTTYYGPTGNMTSQTSTSVCPSSKSYSDGQYSGTLYRTGESSSGSCPTTGGPKNGSCSNTWTASYSGTVYWTHDVWEPKIVWYDSYTGYYSGTIYKDVRQPYDTSFMRSVQNKYVIYVSDNTVSQLSDLQYVMGKHSAKLLLVGQSAIEAQIEHEKFIANNKAIEQVVTDTINYIAESNPAIPKVLKLLGEEITTHTATFDYESDPIPSSADQLQIVQDPNHYDNSLGYDSFAGKTLISTQSESNWAAYQSTLTLNKPGKYTFFRRVKDLPTTDPNFADYAYKSNESAIEVFVHRKPIADVTLDFDYMPASNTYRTTWVDLSYDLDHNITRAATDRGIQDRSIKFTNQGTGEAFTKIPNELAPGTYVLDYVAQDIEGVWSDPIQRTFVLPDTVPVQFKSKLKTEDSGFSLASVPASENLVAHDLWTRYPYSISLAFSMGSYISRSVPYYTGTKNGNDISWNDEQFTIPNTTPDGLYTFSILANGSVAGSTAAHSYSVNVFTPINLNPTKPIANDMYVVGYPATLTATTTKYPSTTTAILFYGTAYARTVSLSPTSTASGKTWNYSYSSFPNVPVGNYVVRFTSTNPSGKSESVNVAFRVTNNTPPYGTFKTYTYDPNNTSMPKFEGDTVHIDPVGIGDNQNDTLDVNYTVRDPDGVVVLNTNYVWNTPYPTAGGPTLVAQKVGTYMVTQTLSDRKASPVVTNGSFNVLPLGITGSVTHTTKWEENRVAYNTANPTKTRSVDTFWAGEEFILASNATNTGTSLVKVDRVTVGLVGQGVTVDLSNTPSGSINWTGTMWRNNFDELPDGNYNFLFTAYYSNGVVKTTTVTVRIKDSIWDVTKTHLTH